MDEIEIFLRQHLQGINENDVASYHETTSPDLTLYEWWVTPHRIDGLPFHEFMMTANAEKGTVFGAEAKGEKAQNPLRSLQPAHPALRRLCGCQLHACSSAPPPRTG